MTRYAAAKLSQVGWNHWVQCQRLVRRAQVQQAQVQQVLRSQPTLQQRAQVLRSQPTLQAQVLVLRSQLALQAQRCWCYGLS